MQVLPEAEERSADVAGKAIKEREERDILIFLKEWQNFVKNYKNLSSPPLRKIFKLVS